MLPPADVDRWAAHLKGWLLALALLPRTWLHAIYRPRSLLIQALRDERRSEREYAPPTLFAAANSIAAIAVGHAVRRPDLGSTSPQGGLVDNYAYGLVALALGNMLLLGLLGLLLRTGASRMDRLFAVLAYGSVVFAPGTLVSSLLRRSHTWEEGLANWFMTRQVMTPTPSMWAAFVLLLTMGLLWFAFLTMGLRVASGRKRRRVVGALISSLCLVLLVEFGALAGPLLMLAPDVANSVAAWGEAHSGILSLARADAYTKMENVLRNLVASEDAPADYRYYCQAAATLLLLAKGTAVQAGAESAGGPPSEILTKQLVTGLGQHFREGEWSRFETLVTQAAQGLEKSGTESQVERALPVGLLLSDVEKMRALRGKSRYPPKVESLEIRFYVGPKGAYLSLWPRSFTGPPHTEYGIAVAQKLADGRNLVWVKYSSENPMYHRPRDPLEEPGRGGVPP